MRSERLVGLGERLLGLGAASGLHWRRDAPQAITTTTTSCVVLRDGA